MAKIASISRIWFVDCWMGMPTHVLLLMMLSSTLGSRWVGVCVHTPTLTWIHVSVPFLPRICSVLIGWLSAQQRDSVASKIHRQHTLAELKKYNIRRKLKVSVCVEIPAIMTCEVYAFHGLIAKAVLFCWFPQYHHFVWENNTTHAHREASRQSCRCVALETRVSLANHTMTTTMSPSTRMSPYVLVSVKHVLLLRFACIDCVCLVSRPIISCDLICCRANGEIAFESGQIWILSIDWWMQE